jgi:hypothetical protein
MKRLVDRLQRHNIVCKKLTPLLPKELGSRKRIDLYIGTDMRGYYCSVMVLAKKSRVLRKEAEELKRLHAKMERHADTVITKKYVGVDAPLCSKAKAWMEAEGWVFL